jgi:SWI/SNF-related matrix-associated actin-dependent regulator 1 of chromatin subfamily A
MKEKALASLIWLGDQLDATDEVREQNGIGFNKADKSNWGVVRGNESAMKALLIKYRNQLVERFGQDVVDSIDWTLLADRREIIQKVREEKKSAEREAKRLAEIAESEAVVQVTAEPLGYGLLLKSKKRIDRDRFQAFLGYVRKVGARCDVNRGYLWTVGADFDFNAFREHLAPFGISIGAIPALSPLVAKTPTAPVKKFDVVVKKEESGAYNVYHPYSDKLNAAYKNAEETSGVIGFDWNKKCRLIGKGQLSDLDEVLEVIRGYYPDWSVGFDFDIEAERTRINAEISARRTDDGSIAPLLKEGMAPLPYQIEGFKWYLELGGCALNGDDMGLGKTFQTLMYAAFTKKRTVVVCPKNVRRQWLQEAQKFFKEGIFNGLELNSTAEVPSLDGYNLVTLNFEIVAKFADLLAHSGFDLLVIDESHRIKNAKAKVTQTITKLGESFAHRICLSGTPIKNKKRELFTQANLIAPGVFKSEHEVLTSTNFAARERMKHFFFRRTKKQELKDLPEKFRQIFPIKPEKKLPDMKKGDMIGDFSALKSELAQAKVPYTIEFVQDILDNTDSKVIVFSDSAPAARAISEHFGNIAVIHDGATSHENREKAKALFNDENSAVRVFVATTGSAREGLNLTIADKVVFNDLPWTPADLNQAEARAHRLGQKNCVNVYWMQAQGNEFDTRSIEIITIKMKLYEAVINGRKLNPEEEKVMKLGVDDLLKVKGLLGQ